jgi:hypothetical protein
MLRLGDIIHFSFDRAPVEIRTSKVFESEYSFQQWAIKDNGVNYTIKDGAISFKAFCEKPKDYFKLHEYLDWIDVEIQNYIRFERTWNNIYIPNLAGKVDRNGVKNDEDVFLPVRDLKFTLNQKQILELLMGVGLYKDKYACLRELYQNALDACRSTQASMNIGLVKTKNRIEFGLLDGEDGKYLYCHDDGIGMNKDVIENYLLNIGNSYYKSSDFFKKQALWNGDFTPTSQFGIGILSCFMIGIRIEITTKTKDGPIISCAIDGPHESFYYKTTSKLDEEYIGNSGTQVKVLLNSEFSGEISNQRLEKVNLLLLKDKPNFNDEFVGYKKYYQNWENHLFNKINELVGVPFSNVDVHVAVNDGSKLRIKNKPYKFDIHEESKDDYSFIDYLEGNAYWDKPKYNLSEVIDALVSYRVHVEHKGLELTCHISLPKENILFESTNVLDIVPIIGARGICIDGITISNNTSLQIELGALSNIEHIGLLNFTGKMRPQLSVDRKSITSWPSNLKEELTILTKELVKSIINVVNNHTAKFSLHPQSEEISLIWNSLFDKFEFGTLTFIDEITSSNFGDVNLEELNNLIDGQTTIKDFTQANSIVINSPNSKKLSLITEKLLYGKLLNASKISFDNEHIRVESSSFSQVMPSRDDRRFRDDEVFIFTDEWDEPNGYDLISGVLPLIPRTLFDAFQLASFRENKQIMSRGMIVSLYSNGIASLFKQNPLLINESIGLFSKGAGGFNQKDNQVYNFQNKRGNYQLTEINSHDGLFKDKKVNVLFAYVSPIKLTQEEMVELDNVAQKDPVYEKGVNEGWSILFTGMKKSNVIIKAGIQSRDSMIRAIPSSFWSEYKEYEFKFLDGTSMTKII